MATYTLPKTAKTYLLRQALTWGLKHAGIRLKLKQRNAASLADWILTSQIPLPRGFTKEALLESARWLATAEGARWLSGLPKAWRGSGVLKVSEPMRASAACSCGQGPRRHVMGNHTGDLVGKGRLKVNTGAMWYMASKDLYKNNDLPALACRESLQNSVDSIRRRIKKGEIQRGRFDVQWENGKLIFRDNGVGMSLETMENVFLSLGNTDKGGDPDSAGGFGIAKAVILGAATKGRWSLRSGDYEIKSSEAYGDYNIFTHARTQGVEVTLWDVDTGYDGSLTGTFQPVPDRLKRVLSASWTPDVDCYYNGHKIKQQWKRGSGGRPKFDDLDWGEENTVVLRSHKRSDGGRGAVWVRLNGLLQFASRLYSEHPTDLIVDMRTRAKPGVSGGGYPFPPSRDSFRGPARGALRSLMEQLGASKVKEQESEFKVFLPDAGSERVSQEYENAMHKALVENRDLFRESLAIAAKAQEEMAKEAGGKFSGGDTGGVDLGLMNDANLVADTVLSGEATVGALPTAIKSVLLQGNVTLTSDLQSALSTLEDNKALDDVEAGTILQGLSSVKDSLLVGGADDSATLVAGVLSNVADALALKTQHPEETRKKAREMNPLGSAGAIMVSRNDYDARKAARFRKNIGKYLPYLLAWDLTLRLVAQATNFQFSYTPGFILQDSVRALASQEGDSGTRVVRLVLINPDKLKKAIKSASGDPRFVARYLHALASHELAHIPFFSRSGESHHEDWAIQRENNEINTSHLADSITKVVQNTLGMDPVTIGIKDHRKLVRSLERKNAAWEKKLKAIRQGAGRVSPTEARRHAKTLSDLNELNSVLSDYYLLLSHLEMGHFGKLSNQLSVGILTYPKATLNTLRVLRSM